MNIFVKIFPWLCGDVKQEVDEQMDFNNRLYKLEKSKEEYKKTIQTDTFLKQPGDNLHNMNKSSTSTILDTEVKRAISELKSARTLIKKALMRLNCTGLGNTLYDLDTTISKLERKLK